MNRGATQRQFARKRSGQLQDNDPHRLAASAETLLLATTSAELELFRALQVHLSDLGLDAQVKDWVNSPSYLLGALTLREFQWRRDRKAILILGERLESRQVAQELDTQQIDQVLGTKGRKQFSSASIERLPVVPRTLRAEVFETKDLMGCAAFVKSQVEASRGTACASKISEMLFAPLLATDVPDSKDGQNPQIGQQEWDALQRDFVQYVEAHHESQALLAEITASRSWRLLQIYRRWVAKLNGQEL